MIAALIWVAVVIASIAAVLFAGALAASQPVFRYQDGQCGESV